MTDEGRSTSVSQWCQQTLKLPQYLDIFKSEGYEFISDLEGLTQKDIEDMGIKPKGHIRRIVREISKLFSISDTQAHCHNGCQDVQEQGRDDTKEYEEEIKQDESMAMKSTDPYPERRGWSGIHYAPARNDVPDASNIAANGRRNKVIMVIGETGTGKTTLLNSMTNYLFDVKYTDPYRFKLIDEDALEKERNVGGESVTDDVTAYYLEPTHPNIDYNITVIDTPGFGDTRGLEKDQEIIGKIKKFLEQRMNVVSGICLAVKASNTRLTAAQKYIFATLLSLFGKDIGDNIFVLITFCDAKKPPCIAALKKTGTPYKKRFKLNNSAFFLDDDSKNSDDSDDSDDDDNDEEFNSNCWDMGMKSFASFFAEIGRTQDKGLAMTKKVLDNRERLLLNIEHLHRQIKQGTSKMSELESTKEQLANFKGQMNQHKEFTITVEVEEEYKEPLPVNVYTTVCTACRFTCHRRCGIADDNQKAGCYAMTNGKCRFCPQKCKWNIHANRPYTWERRPKQIQKTDKDIQARYGNAKKGMSQAQHVLSSIESEIFNLKVKVLDLIKDVSLMNEQLKQFALKHNIVDQQEYIKLMITAEKKDLKLGWEKRVNALENLKGMLTTLQSIDTQNYDEALKKITMFSGAKGHSSQGWMDKGKAYWEKKKKDWFS